ncbi:MAG TPA: hypothetical protein QF355_05000 [Candidatus Marinimicrobia bacterium]|jgi:hypothetical protein|nr:hypothetical protein [Candidatus Neomarinimicrobiota bacterium]|tara:strand:+ start:772 stop:1593 length:822 start_codon:yes stop_codon:yes gene_type:complete
MKIKFAVVLALLFQGSIFSQDIYYKVEYGKGSATMSDVYVQMEIGRLSGEFEAKRVKSSVRDADMEFSTNIDDYVYYGDYIKLLLGVLSFNADGITIKVGENSEQVITEIKKMSYSLNDWDLFIDFEEGPRTAPILNANFNLQDAKITLPRDIKRNMGTDERLIYNAFANAHGSILIKKLSYDFSIDRNGMVSAEGNLDMPVGKAKVNVSLISGNNFRSKPYIEMLELDFTNLSPDLQNLMDDLVDNEEVPLKKTRTGYSLRMSGDIDNPRIY